MSRVHDALRRAEQAEVLPAEAPYQAPEPPRPPEPPPVAQPPVYQPPVYQSAASAAPFPAASPVKLPPLRLNLSPSLLDQVQMVAFSPAPESHLLDLNASHETPAEEFRTLRTRLNHLQTLQPLHTIVVTSPSPA